MIATTIQLWLPTLLAAAAGFVPAVLLIALAVADALTTRQLRYASRHHATLPPPRRPRPAMEGAMRRAAADAISGRGFVIG